MPNGPQFLSCGSFDPWSDVSRHPSAEIFKSLFECYTAYYSGQVEGWRSRMTSGSAVCSGSAGPVPTGGSPSVPSTSSQVGRGSKRVQRPGKSC